LLVKSAEITTPLYSRRETACHIEAYTGQASPLLSCRLYHKLKRHESWHGLPDQIPAVSTGFLARGMSLYCWYQAPGELAHLYRQRHFMRVHSQSGARTAYAR